MTDPSPPPPDNLPIRYVIRWPHEGFPHPIFPDETGAWLQDTTDGGFVFDDGMQPEDATLCRDLKPLVDLMNRHAADAESERLARMEAEEAISKVLAPFGVQFMDPPDGGGVTMHEQLRRMSQALVDTDAEVAGLRREVLTRTTWWQQEGRRAIDMEQVAIIRKGLIDRARDELKATQADLAIMIAQYEAKLAELATSQEDLHRALGAGVTFMRHGDELVQAVRVARKALASIAEHGLDDPRKILLHMALGWCERAEAEHAARRK